MPGKEVKELYMAKSLDELRAKTKITNLDYSPKVLLGSAKVLHRNAMTGLLGGDEERSYVLFMKFVELALHVKRMKHVSEKEFEETFGGQNVNLAINKLEELQKNLSKRYAELAKSKGGGQTVVESGLKSVKEETGKSNEAGALSNGSLDERQSSVILVDQFPSSSISSWDLRNLIMRGKCHILLLDTRSVEDYGKSHMCFNKIAPHCRTDLTTVINVPKDVLKRGLTPKSLEKLLPVESLIGWNKRKESDLIVLLDWDTDNSNAKPDSPVVTLKEIMTKWEMEISYKHPPIILERGYFDWVNTFPMMTTNPHVKTPIKTKSTAAIIPNNDLYFSNLVNQDDILDDLDDVEYPALIDSPPKVTPPALDEDSASIPKVFPSVTKSGSTEKGVAPVVDRSSKPAALSSPKASPITSTITKKPVLPAVPVELTNREIPKEIVENKSDSEIMMEKAQPEPSNVNRYVENEDENKVAKEEIRLSPKIIKDDVKAPSKVINEDAGIPPKITNGDARMLPKIIKDDVKAPPTITKIPVVDRSLKAKVLQQQVEEDKGQAINMETRRGSKEEPDLEESRKPNEVLVKQNSKTNYLLDENKEEENKQPKKMVERDEWHVPINFEPSPGSSMKRSRSFQNVSRLMDDQECPKVNRSVKPISKTEVLSARRRIDGVYGNVGRGLTGLRNLGNSCYMNSILQCISHTTILMRYFCDGKYRDDVNRSTKMKGEVADEVAALVRALWGGEYRSIACRGLKGVVGMHKEAFAGYEQQDSHEFLTILMDWLHEDLNRAGQKSIQKGSYNSEGSNQNASGLEGAVKAWKEFCSKNESLVLQLFYGQQASTVRCLTCGEESVTYEPFSNLSLPIPPNATRCTLSDCMSLYLKGEVINGWNCPRCKEPRDAVKKFDIWILPEILVIHFKRFTSDGWCRKKQTMVDFPLEDLNVSSWVTMDSGSLSHHKRNTLYNLYGVSNHYGTIDGGHYTAHCKSSVFHKWYKFDDHEVSELSPSDVVSPAAYILFYSSVDVS